MKKIQRTSFIFFVLFSCVGCDQVTKDIARQSLAGHGKVSLLGDTLRLTYTENPGAFLSLGAHIPDHYRYLVFTCLVGLFLAGLFIYLLKSRQLNNSTAFALSLTLGGGIGNLIDRILHHGRVIDFLNLGVGSLRTGIFNVADIAITVGVGWLAWLSLRSGRRSGESMTRH